MTHEQPVKPKTKQRHDDDWRELLLGMLEDEDHVVPEDIEEFCKRLAYHDLGPITDEDRELMGAIVNDCPNVIDGHDGYGWEYTSILKRRGIKVAT